MTSVHRLSGPAVGVHGASVGQPAVTQAPRVGAPALRVASRNDVDLDDLTDVRDIETAVPRDVLTRQDDGMWAPEALPAPPPSPSRHVQQAPATRWQHVHNLGWRPHYVVRDSEGRIYHPENVEHPVPGVISEIVFGFPMLGTADPS